MNNSYWANAPDLFKWDLLSYLAKIDCLSIFYVDMETPPRPKENDLKYLTYEIGTSNEILYNFLKTKLQNTESTFFEIEEYFSKMEIPFTHFKEFLNLSNFFEQNKREEYFESVIETHKRNKGPSIIFIDPDVGSDINIHRRFRSKREMYLKSTEILKIKASLKTNDFLAYFQHLGNSNYSLENRISGIKEYLGEWSLIAGYSRIQASLVFVFKDEAQYLDKRKKIIEYFKQYEYLDHKQKFVIL